VELKENTAFNEREKPKNRGCMENAKNIFTPSLIYHLIRILLSLIFLWSGISKLIHPSEFAVIIDSYGLIPEALNMPLAIILPLFELIFGLGLLLDIKESLTGIAGLLTLFMAILGYGIWMGLDVDCGCFGVDDPEALAFHGLRLALIRDIVMMAGIFYLYYRRANKVAALKRR